MKKGYGGKVMKEGREGGGRERERERLRRA